MKTIKTEKEVLDQGLCLYELRRCGMSQWATSQSHSHSHSHSQSSDDHQLPLSTSCLLVKSQQQQQQLVQTELTTTPHNDTITNNKNKRKRSTDKPTFNRWSPERYKLAEESMFDVLKGQGATFDKPISRPQLRMAARKLIGDTGLLDHLLKHLDGRLAPRGKQRFRRCYNTQGVMVYWLQTADQINLPPHTTAAAAAANVDQLALLKAQMDDIKRDMQEVIHKRQERDKSDTLELDLLKSEMEKMKLGMEELILCKQNKSNQIEEMHKELAEWKSKTDKHLMDISISLTGVQDMNIELITWKATIEQQLMEISSSMSSRKLSKQCEAAVSPSPSESWEDWLESTSLDNVQGGDPVSWLGSTDLVNGDILQQDVHPPQSQPLESPQDPFCTDLELFKEEMAKRQRDVHGLVPRRQEEDQVTVTPDSSVTGNSKSDIDSSLLLFQEMFKELAKWKEKIERQMAEISYSVRLMEASQPFTVDFNF